MTTTDTAEEVFVVPAKEVQEDHYEILLLIAGTVAEDEAAKTFEEVKQLIQSQQGVLTHNEALGRKTLGYSVAGSSVGNFFVAEFNLPKLQLKEVQEKLRIRKDITRYLIIKKKLKTAEDLAEEQRIREKIAVRKQVKKQEVAMEEAKVAEAEKIAKKKEVAAPVATTPVATTPVTPTQGAAAEKTPEEQKPAAEPTKTIEELDKEIDKLLSDDMNF